MKTHLLKKITSPRLLAYLWLEKNRLCTQGHHSVFVSQLLLDETINVLPHLYFGKFIPPGVDVSKKIITEDDKITARSTFNIEISKITIKLQNIIFWQLWLKITVIFIIRY